MSDEQIIFLPYEEALQLVAAIQEEEDIDDPSHRILTVYDHQDKEICWFDFDETMRDAGISKNDETSKARLTEYNIQPIPDWAKEI